MPPAHAKCKTVPFIPAPVMWAHVPGLFTVSTTIGKRVSPLLLMPSIGGVVAFSFTLLSFGLIATLTVPVPATIPSSVVSRYVP